MRCSRVEADGDGVHLSFTDGSAHDADVVIGADGIHSVVRELVAVPESPTYSGMCAFRTLVPGADAPDFALRPAQTLWLGPDHHLVHYPISGGAAVNIVAFAPAGDFTEESWTATATVPELLAEFEGWDHRLTELIARAGVPGRWALLDRAPLPCWTAGRITLLGDAAHPMFPFYAQGAAQAIEDAAVLAQCLSADVDTPERALLRYETLRRPRTTKVQYLSHSRKHINHLPDGPEQVERDRNLQGSDPLVESAWLYGYDAEAAAREADTQ